MTPGRGVRIQKFISRAGVASRRRAEELMQQGRVRVNGAVVTTMGTRVDPSSDVVSVDGERVRPPAIRWVAFHKPAGTLTTRHDPKGRRTIYDVLPAELGHLRYVGRLDYGTEGLLLLTNDGDGAHELLHPSFGLEREYRARVKRVPEDATLERLTRGVDLDDGPARARLAWRVRGEASVVGLVLTEGRKREVRRLLEAVGHPVVGLKRMRFGPVELGDLAVGAWRDLTEDERRRLDASRRNDAESE